MAASQAVATFLADLEPSELHDEILEFVKSLPENVSMSWAITDPLDEEAVEVYQGHGLGGGFVGGQAVEVGQPQ